MASKVGSIVLTTDQGLGYLAKAFFDHGVIHKVFIHPHTTRTNHPDWYPPEAVVASVDELVDECDTLLFFETPFDWKAIPKARAKGKRTVLMPMYECTPFPFHYEPDFVLSPSLLDFQLYKHKRGAFCRVPVEVKWRLRTKARVFVHNAGNGGLGGRNGTNELLLAMPFVKSPIRLIIRSQTKLSGIFDPRVEFVIGTVPPEELWKEGDVFIFPEKFNGLSLPLQEAFASGMLVMAGNRYPMNTWLPTDPLIPVARYTKESISIQFDCAQYDPETIAHTIDAWYDKDIAKYSRMGKTYAELNSWQMLQGIYEEYLAR